jgi:LmbE family N-acetylglucosaminyl deacetylase
MNILIIGAHPDDEALSMGATIKKHSDEGNDVYLCVLSGNAAARSKTAQGGDLRTQAEEAEKLLGIKDADFFDFPNIKMNTVPMLEVVQAIESSITKFKPEVIYTHWGGDLNIDHRVVYDATMAAIRLPQRETADMPMDQIKRVLCYETPSSTEWAAPLPSNAFLPNVFVKVDDQMSIKMEAIKLYKGILRKVPHARSPEAIYALATLRGAQAGYKYAEAFVLIRELK